MYGDVDGLRELCDNTADDDQLKGGLSLLPTQTQSVDEASVGSMGTMRVGAI